jgi:hypothetical protein
LYPTIHRLLLIAPAAKISKKRHPVEMIVETFFLAEEEHARRGQTFHDLLPGAFSRL